VHKYLLAGRAHDLLILAEEHVVDHLD